MKTGQSFDSALKAAIRLLARRARSRDEMAQRLARKEFSQPVIGRVLAWLEERRLLDDEAFARAWIQDQTARKPAGPAYLRAGLRKRGIAKECVDAAIARFREEAGDEGSAAADLARRRLGSRSPADPVVRRRLGAYLVRRGFSVDLVKRVLRRFQAELPVVEPSRMNKEIDVEETSE